jgi:hypothetical protein
MSVSVHKTKKTGISPPNVSTYKVMEIMKRKVLYIIFSKNKCCVMSSEGFSAPEKKPRYVLRGQCCCPSRWV